MMIFLFIPAPVPAVFSSPSAGAGAGTGTGTGTGVNKHREAQVLLQRKLQENRLLREQKKKLQEQQEEVGRELQNDPEHSKLLAGVTQKDTATTPTSSTGKSGQQNGPTSSPARANSRAKSKPEKRQNTTKSSETEKNVSGSNSAEGLLPQQNVSYKSSPGVQKGSVSSVSSANNPTVAPPLNKGRTSKINARVQQEVLLENAVSRTPMAGAEVPLDTKYRGRLLAAATPSTVSDPLKMPSKLNNVGSVAASMQPATATVTSGSKVMISNSNQLSFTKSSAFTPVSVTPTAALKCEPGQQVYTSGNQSHLEQTSLVSAVSGQNLITASNNQSPLAPKSSSNMVLQGASAESHRVSSAQEVLQFQAAATHSPVVPKSEQVAPPVASNISFQQLPAAAAAPPMTSLPQQFLIGSSGGGILATCTYGEAAGMAKVLLSPAKNTGMVHIPTTPTRHTNPTAVPANPATPGTPTNNSQPRFAPIKPRTPNTPKTVSDLLKQRRGYGVQEKPNDKRPLVALLKERRARSTSGQGEGLEKEEQCMGQPAGGATATQEYAQSPQRIDLGKPALTSTANQNSPSTPLMAVAKDRPREAAEVAPSRVPVISKAQQEERAAMLNDLACGRVRSASEILQDLVETRDKTSGDEGKDDLCLDLPDLGADPVSDEVQSHENLISTLESDALMGYGDQVDLADIMPSISEDMTSLQVQTAIDNAQAFSSMGANMGLMPGSMVPSVSAAEQAGRSKDGPFVTPVKDVNPVHEALRMIVTPSKRFHPIETPGHHEGTQASRVKANPQLPTNQKQPHNQSRKPEQFVSPPGVRRVAKSASAKTANTKTKTSEDAAPPVKKRRRSRKKDKGMINLADEAVKIGQKSPGQLLLSPRDNDDALGKNLLETRVGFLGSLSHVGQGNENGNVSTTATSNSHTVPVSSPHESIVNSSLSLDGATATSREMGLHLSITGKSLAGNPAVATLTQQLSANQLSANQLSANQLSANQLMQLNIDTVPSSPFFMDPAPSPLSIANQRSVGPSPVLDNSPHFSGGQGMRSVGPSPVHMLQQQQVSSPFPPSPAQILSPHFSNSMSGPDSAASVNSNSMDSLFREPLPSPRAALTNQRSFGQSPVSFVNQTSVASSNAGIPSGHVSHVHPQVNNQKLPMKLVHQMPPGGGGVNQNSAAVTIQGTAFTPIFSSSMQGFQQTQNVQANSGMLGNVVSTTAPMTTAPPQMNTALSVQMMNVLQARQQAMNAAQQGAVNQRNANQTLGNDGNVLQKNPPPDYYAAILQQFSMRQKLQAAAGSLQTGQQGVLSDGNVNGKLSGLEQALQLNGQTLQQFIFSQGQGQISQGQLSQGQMPQELSSEFQAPGKPAAVSSSQHERRRHLSINLPTSSSSSNSGQQQQPMSPFSPEVQSIMQSRSVAVGDGGGGGSGGGQRARSHSVPDAASLIASLDKTELSSKDIRGLLQHKLRCNSVASNRGIHVQSSEEFGARRNLTSILEVSPGSNKMSRHTPSAQLDSDCFGIASDMSAMDNSNIGGGGLAEGQGHEGQRLQQSSPWQYNNSSVPTPPSSQNTSPDFCTEVLNITSQAQNVSVGFGRSGSIMPTPDTDTPSSVETSSQPETLNDTFFQPSAALGNQGALAGLSDNTSFSLLPWHLPQGMTST